MDNHPIEALIWMTALAAAIERARNASSHRERLSALEAIDDARQSLDEALSLLRDELAMGLDTRDGPRALVS
jgi:hypothetical protein